VVTLNGWTLPWRMNGELKEFHLVAEPVTREFAPGMTVNLWGYNGQAPGPTIEAVEGDKIRVFVTNKLPEHTTIHWHGMLVPNGMDGVGGLTQPHIPVGKTFVYEFQLKKSDTFIVNLDYDLHHELLQRDAWRIPAECRRDDGLQHVDVEFARIPRHRRAAGETRRSRASGWAISP
jgi:hypothetical protein